MLNPAEKYLKLRSIGAPAVLLSLAMQGIFRGFKDTTTPLYVIGSFKLYIFFNDHHIYFEKESVLIHFFFILTRFSFVDFI